MPHRFARRALVPVAIALLSGCDAAQVGAVADLFGLNLTDDQAAAVANYHNRPRSVPDMIRAAWEGTGHEERAVRVARCESGFNPSARNGQYRGVFQMGAREWATYGRGSAFDAAANIAAARRYWDLAGWRPWQCKG